MMSHSLIARYSIAVILFCAINFLAWYYLNRCCRVKKRSVNATFFGIVILAAVLQSVDGVMFAFNIFDSKFGETCSMLGFSWQLGGILCVPLLLLYAFHSLVGRIFAFRLAVTVRRGYFLLGVLMYALAFAGMYNGWSHVVTTRESFSDKSYHGTAEYRAAFFSDLHLGNVYNLSSLKSLLADVQREKPNVLLIGGDLLDDKRLIKPAIRLIDEFCVRTAIPVYFVMGNHEYYCDAPAVVRELSCSHIRLLQNNVAQLPGNIFLAGGDYPLMSGYGMKFDRASAENALRLMTVQIPADSVKVLFAHSPEYIEVINGRKMFDLALAGHTHGGQAKIAGVGVFGLKFPYLSGRYDLGNITAIVSNGVGSWMPFRINCPAEINIIRIVK